ncbi:MAG: filamentous hemagglutinin N-terminal domain-containing protein, partial [Magnetococcales bacterium]|nr:filamentous hemagglutinin N-terminal domain-containing protein [Magnetococcales bacterium]
MDSKKKDFNIRNRTRGTLRRGALSLAALCALMVPMAARANPEGGSVVAGSATITRESATKLGITQHTDKAIINWKSFNIGANEHTQFRQPSASSVALNRVVGSADPSRILGKLSANGRIFLVNPNGVVFGKNAVVDVAALVATTHDIRNEDFLAGRMNFTMPGNAKASVINRGSITVADQGLVSFVAPGVQNAGVIVARLGKVQLASANGFTLDLYGDQLIQLMVDDEVAEQAIDEEGNPLKAQVDNAGRITADGGYVLLTAKAARGVVNKVVNTSGVIEARSVMEKDGEIILSGGTFGQVTVDGVLDASGKGDGEFGGKVQVTGETIHLTSRSRIDVSGNRGGGKVLVGGDHLGGTADSQLTSGYGLTMESYPVPRATDVNIAAGSIIEANAIHFGNGGKIVIWADNTTNFEGVINARGGIDGGDGGVVETSGFVNINQLGSVDVSAPNGVRGVYIVDPEGEIVSYLSWSAYVHSTSGYREDPENISSVISNGMLYLRPSLSSKSYYWSNFLLDLPEELSAENSKLEIVVRNNSLIGGLSGYDTNVYLRNTVSSGGFGARFMGASWADSYTNIWAGSTSMRGLSSLVKDLTDWHTLSVETDSGIMSVYYDNIKIQEIDASTANKYNRIHLLTKGGGQIQSVKLWNNGNLIVNDDFSKTTVAYTSYVTESSEETENSSNESDETSGGESTGKGNSGSEAGEEYYDVDPSVGIEDPGDGNDSRTPPEDDDNEEKRIPSPPVFPPQNEQIYSPLSIVNTPEAVVIKSAITLVGQGSENIKILGKAVNAIQLVDYLISGEFDKASKKVAHILAGKIIGSPYGFMLKSYKIAEYLARTLDRKILKIAHYSVVGLLLHNKNS